MSISIIISSLMIAKAFSLYKFFKSFVAFFERDTPYKLIGETSHWDLKDHIIVVGSHQVGEALVKYFQKEGVPLIVLDFNPYQVEKLMEAKIPVVFGDMGDPEVLESLNLNEARMLISTVPNLTDNKLLIEEVKDRKLNIPVIVRSESYHEAKSLYKFGASFVFVPDIVSGEFLVEMLKNHLNDKDYFKDRPKIEMEKLEKKTLAWE